VTDWLFFVAGDNLPRDLQELESIEIAGEACTDIRIAEAQGLITIHCTVPSFVPPPVEDEPENLFYFDVIIHTHQAGGGTSQPRFCYVRDEGALSLLSPWLCLLFSPCYCMPTYALSQLQSQ
jgi:hypothetical protein